MSDDAVDPAELKLTTGPADPDLTDEARTVLAYVQSLPGEGWLAGQQENDDRVDEEQAYIREETGTKPALRGFDVAEYIVNPIEEVIDSWHEHGQLVTLSWHLCAPLTGSSYQNCLTEADVEACLTEGTEEHDFLMDKLSWMADRLETLRAERVPVFWRPYHEMDGEWFWWSTDGPETFCRLWVQMYEYFVEERGLHNLLWVWSRSHEPAAGWYPGEEYVDVTGVDTYRNQRPNLDWGEHYEGILDESSEKPVSLAECDEIPDPDDVRADYPFVWFLPWHTSLIRYNDEDHIREVYDHPYTITVEGLPGFRSGGHP